MKMMMTSAMMTPIYKHAVIITQCKKERYLRLITPKRRNSGYR